MHERKYYITIGDYERSIILASLNEFRNKLISENKYIDAVNELIIKFAHAPIKI